MNRSTAYLLIGAAAIILGGTFVMYAIESKVPNTEIKTLGDSLWWVVETITTVGYGDIVPISSLGRTVALVFMFGGILIITTIMSVVSTGFYKKRVSKEESERRQEEFEHLKKVLVDKLSDIEEKQTRLEEKQAKFYELVNDLRSSLEKRELEIFNINGANIGVTALTKARYIAVNFDTLLYSVFRKINFGCCNLCFKQEKLNVYFSEMFSLPSLIKLYRMSILLFTPINKPTEIINKKSNTMVASITVESLA